MTTQINGWDHQSGVRERLALLAAEGPDLNPALWGYHTSRDFWYACGDRMTRTAQGKRIDVKQEGVASLELIATRYGMDRRAAMQFIGYPERTPCLACHPDAYPGAGQCCKQQGHDGPHQTALGDRVWQ